MFNKIATIIAMAIVAMAFTMNANAQSFNTINFSGVVNRSDVTVAQVSVAGSLTDYSATAPLRVHFSDIHTSEDFWCTASTATNNGFATMSTPIDETGWIILNVAQMNCVNQRSGKPVSGSGTFIFATSLQQAGNTYLPTVLSLQAQYMNVMFPGTPMCVYQSFNGMGTDTNPN